MAQTEHRSTQRVLDILELLAFSDASNGLSLTEIATTLSCPKSSISPMLRTLVKGGYLCYDQALMKYTIGRRVFEVGNAYVERDNFYDQALTVMRKVVDLCLESCHLAELQGSDALYLLKVDSPESIRMFSAPGKRLPAYSTALGKALLSRCSYQELERIFKGGLKPVTDKTIVDMDELYRQILEIRRTGLAYEKEENSEFIQCVAVPIEKGGQPVMALSVSVPTFRYSEEKGARIEELLLDARRDLELLI